MIEFLNFITLRGPNLWTYRPVMEAWVDIGALEDSPSNTIPGFNDRLTTLLPSLIEHRCSYGEHGGFLKRLEEGTWPAHILEHVTLELQNLAGMPGGFGKARSTSQRGVYKVAVRCWHEDITRQALLYGRDLVLAAINATAFDVAVAVAHIAQMADRLLLGPSTQAIVEAATAKHRRIPVIRLNEGNLVQLGYGMHSRRIWTAETDATSAIAESISSDKALTNTLLRACGVPVPEGSIVKSATEAWEEAQSINAPVAIKPVDGNHGRGVSVNLSRREDIEAAFTLAQEAARGSEVLVERFIPGIEHRLLVVGGKLVAAARGEEAWVVGNGQSTVQQLIDQQINNDPRRGTDEACPLNRIHDDPAVALELTRQGSAIDAVPAAGKRLLIQRNGNVAFDCTDDVHPDTTALAALAARIVGLDIAGIDLVATDIAQPLAAQGGAIVEVNAGPGLLMHLKPASGQPRPVGPAIVDYLFPEGSESRIPLVGITGSAGATLAAQRLDHILRLTGQTTGLACAQGVFLGTLAVTTQSLSPGAAAQTLLINRQTEVVVIENSIETMLNEGLAYDRCQVGVVTALDPAALLPAYHIDSPERLFNVVRTQVDVVLPSGVAVLNAACPLVRDMAALCDGEVIFFAATTREDAGEDAAAAEAAAAAIATHRAQGGRAVLMRADTIILADASGETTLLDLSDLPPHMAGQKVGADEATALQGGRAKNALFAVADGNTPRSKPPWVPVTNETLTPLLAAIGAAWALNVPLATLRTGIETF
ncbi:cyanophycin synthetase [Rugosibacter aromaticivorans]|uniref:Cyanophycin synthetase n=1 Tax=Rugosibacter aromaticivorans TaxID=1565605 RepID=A0A0C5J654_9PROT|nr:cyanophycin synthetase [Rugosibacter aromaticivorans]AJP47470.1 cyanophycin synthetase [Rugosibacter aromaticivorans]TBR13056.1 MAG: cyanophycin synthetase [Rugosibacter sp.]